MSPSQADQPFHVGLMVPYTGMGQRLLRGINRFVALQKRWAILTQGTKIISTLDHIEAHRDELQGVLALIWSRPDLDRLKSLGLPLVDISGTLAHTTQARVRLDDRAIAEAGAEYLLAKGFGRLAFSWTYDNAYSLARRDAFTRRAEQAGIEPIISPRFGGVPGGQRYQAMRDWMAALPTPIGVMAVHDNHGRQLIHHAEALGLRVPEDIAILGVDNDEMQTELAALPMSSIDPNFEKVGYEAAKLLDHLMRGGAPPDGPMLIPPMGVITRRSTETTPVEDEDVTRAMRFIHEHSAEPIRMPDVLKETLVSRKTLENKFREHLGVTPHQYLIRRRVEHACRLLRDSDQPLYRIAEAAGFERPTRFSTSFLKVTGMTPTAYRRQHRVGG